MGSAGAEDMRAKGAIKYSVVVPVFNEEQSVEPLYRKLKKVMESISEPWEVIFVNDGSADGTAKVVRHLATPDSCFRFIEFDRNYGKTAALDAGFKKSRGEYIVTIDGDLQDDPDDIPKLVELLEEYDMVCGWREKRRDPKLKVFISLIANRFRRFFTKDRMHDIACGLKVFRRECMAEFQLFEGLHRFFPVLFLCKGYKVTEIPVNHRPRQFGKSKYGPRLKTFLDLIAAAWMRQRYLTYHIKDQSDQNNS